MGHVDMLNGIETAMQGPCGLARKIYDWDFSVFELYKRTGGRPLYHVTLALLEDQQLLDGWLLDREVVECYLAAVEAVYKANPYHNSTHAADVTQTAGIIMTALNHWMHTPQNITHHGLNNSSGCNHSCARCLSCGRLPPSCTAAATHCSHSSRCHIGAAAAAADAAATSSSTPCLLGGNCNTSSSSSSSSSNSSSAGGGSGSSAPVQQQHPVLPPQPQPQQSPGCPPGLSKLERFAIILASAVHDLGHPGVNNAFLVRTRDKQALTYNDRSVNEMMHASLAFELALGSPELNLFRNFSEADYELVRKLVLDMVLSTDMDVHFTLLKRYEDALTAQPDVRLWASVEGRSLVFQMLVHLADLANPSRPWPLALKWAEWVVTEFLSQGEKEAAANIPISPPCDASKVCMPAAQLFFIERFMAPTLAAFRTSAPAFYDMAAPWLADTAAKWGVFKAAGVRFPHQGYPELPPLSGTQAGRLAVTLEGRPRCCSACCPATPQQQEQEQLPAVQQQQQCWAPLMEGVKAHEAHVGSLQRVAQQPAAHAAG